MARIPAAARKRAIAVLALATLVLLSAWEWHARSADRLDDRGQLVRDAADRVCTPSKPDGRRVVVLGSSRAMYGIIPDVLERELGNGWEVRMAALPSASGAVQLHSSLDKLEDGDVVVIDCLAVAMYTLNRSSWETQFERQVDRAAIGWLEKTIWEPVKSNLLLTQFASSPLGELKFFLGQFRGEEQTETADNIWPSGTVVHEEGWLEYVGEFQLNHARDSLMFLINTAAKHRAEDSTAAIELLRRDIAVLDSRGIQVVLLQLPTEGEYASAEERLFPRARYWDRLAQVAPGRAWHFADFEVTRGLKTWDNHHVTGTSAKVYSRWLGARLRGLVEDNSR